MVVLNNFSVDYNKPMGRTVRELSEEEKRQYIESLRKREEQEKILLKERYKKALQLAKEVSKILYEKYRAEKVYLVGSLKDEELFTKWSDIDLAVSGIPPHLYFKAIAEILYLSKEFKIDIIDLDNCEERIKEKLISEGILL